MKDGRVLDGGYKLLPTDQPELYKLKSAHQELLDAYVRSLAALSRLSFFVGVHEVSPVRSQPIRKMLRLIFQGRFSPFRASVWQPMVKLYIESHVHNKMRELKVIYKQEKYRLTSLAHRTTEQQKWLEQAQVDCDELLATINSGKIVFDTLRFILVSIINFLIAAWGASSLSDLGLRIVASETPTRGLEIVVKLIIFTILALPFFFSFISAAFNAKRDIFLNINLGKSEAVSVYQLENRLFDLLGRGKSPEAPIDYFVETFFFASFITYIYLLKFLFQITLQIGQSPEIIYIEYVWCLILPIILYYLFNIIKPWWQREVSREL